MLKAPELTTMTADPSTLIKKAVSTVCLIVLEYGGSQEPRGRSVRKTSSEQVEQVPKTTNGNVPPTSDERKELASVVHQIMTLYKDLLQKWNDYQVPQQHR